MIGKLRKVPIRREEQNSYRTSAKEYGHDLDANFQAKDNKLVIANFKAVLVMNLDRRFTYATKGIDDYAESKLLLAKAKATYETLEPYMGSGTAKLIKHSKLRSTHWGIQGCSV